MAVAQVGQAFMLRMAKCLTQARVCAMGRMSPFTSSLGTNPALTQGIYGPCPWLCVYGPCPWLLDHARTRPCPHEPFKNLSRTFHGHSTHFTSGIPPTSRQAFHEPFMRHKAFPHRPRACPMRTLRMFRMRPFGMRPVHGWPKSCHTSCECLASRWVEPLPYTLRMAGPRDMGKVCHMPHAWLAPHRPWHGRHTPSEWLGHMNLGICI